MKDLILLVFIGMTFCLYTFYRIVHHQPNIPVRAPAQICHSNNWNDTLGFLCRDHPLWSQNV